MSPTPVTASSIPDHGALTGREQQIAVLGSWNQVGHVVYVLSELKVPDLLEEGPRTAADLASATESHPDSLERVLRCAAAVGIVHESEEGRFTLTELGGGLKSARLGGLRPMVQFSTSDLVRLPYTEILHSVKTGEPAFQRVFGMPFYDYLEANPTSGDFFVGFLAHWSRRLADRFADELGMERFKHVADIGAGDGYFLAKALERAPGATAELFDLPELVDKARELIEEQGLADRVSVAGGDFFTDALPRGCEAYILKSIIHNWSDEDSVRILRAVRDAMGDTDSRLLIIDQVVPPRNEWDHAKMLDIDMLVLFGGKERDLQEWQALFEASGFELTTPPERRGWSVLECRPLPLA